MSLKKITLFSRSLYHHHHYSTYHWQQIKEAVTKHFFYHWDSVFLNFCSNFFDCHRVTEAQKQKDKENKVYSICKPGVMLASVFLCFSGYFFLFATEALKHRSKRQGKIKFIWSASPVSCLPQCFCVSVAIFFVCLRGTEAQKQKTRKIKFIRSASSFAFPASAVYFLGCW